MLFNPPPLNPAQTFTFNHFGNFLLTPCVLADSLQLYFCKAITLATYYLERLLKITTALFGELIDSILNNVFPRHVQNKTRVVRIDCWVKQTQKISPVYFVHCILCRIKLSSLKIYFQVCFS